MTDTVMLAAIAIVPSTLAAVFGFLNNALGRRHEQQIQAAKEQIHETKIAVVTLEKNTNSIKDALVQVTGEKAFAEGVKHGEEQARQEERHS